MPNPPRGTPGGCRPPGCPARDGPERAPGRAGEKGRGAPSSAPCRARRRFREPLRRGIHRHRRPGHCPGCPARRSLQNWRDRPGRSLSCNALPSTRTRASGPTCSGSRPERRLPSSTRPPAGSSSREHEMPRTRTASATSAGRRWEPRSAGISRDRSGKPSRAGRAPREGTAGSPRRIQTVLS